MDSQPDNQAISSARRLLRNPVAVSERASAQASRDETDGILFALAQAVEQRDRQTAGHCERLAFIGVAIGMALRLDDASLQTLYRGGFLHDVGKVGIPDSILFKPANLTADEWIIMRSHSARGEEICRHLKSLACVLPIIRHHHERWDGTGYPDGLRDQQIPLLARVVQIADIYDALTNPRPYKPAFPAGKALRIIEEETARGWRDPEVVQIFLKVHKKIVTKIGYYNSPADCNLAALRNSLTDFHALMEAVA